MLTSLAWAAVIPTAAAAAPAPGVTLQLDGHSEVVYGQIGEFVYSSQSSRPDSDLLSRLDWDLKPAVLTGIGLALQLPQGIHLNGSFAGAVPMFTGKMENRDWREGYEPLDNDDPETPTDYSQHKTYLQGAYTADAYLGWHYNAGSLQAGPLIGFAAMYFSMDGRDGEGEYPPPTGERDFYGPVISYRQYYSIPYLGISARFTPAPSILLEPRLRFSVLAQADGVDHHFYRRIEFYDYPRFGRYFDADLRISGEMDSGSSIFLQIGGTLVPEFRGDSYALNTETGSTSSSTAAGGASLRLLRLSAGVSLSRSLLE